MLEVLLLVLALSNAAKINGEEGSNQCDYAKQTLKLKPRPHSVSILEFGAVGDGKTLNTIAFQNAIFYLKSFADKGGAQLYVPSGKWLTGSINLTSHLTLFLEKGAVILGSQDPSHWDVVDPLPSYGRGIEFPGKRYRSLINGYMLHDVVVTGLNGTIDGQGSVWWDWFLSGALNYSRPHLIEFVDSDNIVVSNLTFINAPAYNIHPVYCSDVHIHNLSLSTPPDSPYTVGIVLDSSDDVCVEDCTIATGHDSISLKSGWDEYGISYGRPTKNVHMRYLRLESNSGASISFGSEMSGGVSDVAVERVGFHNSRVGAEFRTQAGRGGFIEDVIISDVEIVNVGTAFAASGDYGSHPDEGFNPEALPILDRITIREVNGAGIGAPGSFLGIEESPFTSICLFNISLSLNSHSNSTEWVCSNVSGSSDSVSPEPCPELKTGSSSACFSLFTQIGKASALR